jgi:hypothetical protein
VRLACLWLVALFIGFLLTSPVAVTAVPAGFTYYDAGIQSNDYFLSVASPDGESSAFGAAIQPKSDAIWPENISLRPTGVAAKAEANAADKVVQDAAESCSFSGSTSVLMADATKKPIEDVEVGDLVLATDPETGEQAAKRVEHVFVHDDALTDLQLADGTRLTTSDDHPYWSADDQRFERADEVSDGEGVLGADGQAVEVSGLKLATTRDGLAYNLSVEGIHTYHVGDDAILVHNTCAILGRRGAFGEAKNRLGIPRTEQPSGTLEGYFDRAGNWRSDGRTYFFRDDTVHITEHYGEPGQLPHFHPGAEGGDPHIYYGR